MQRVDSFGNTASLPAAEAQVNPPGYFTIGNPTLSIPATVVPAWWCNQITEELLYLLTQAGVTPDKADFTQVYESIIGLSQNFQETSFLIANNQTSFANITGMVLDKLLFKSAIISFDVYRKDATPTEVSAVGELYPIYKPVLDTWSLEGPELKGDNVDDIGLEFDITSAGQVRYKSSNFTGGSYSGTLRFKFNRFKI